MTTTEHQYRPHGGHHSRGGYQMTIKEYREWDGTFTMAERAKAEEREQAMFKTLTETEIDEYFNLCSAHVYAFVDFGAKEDRRTAKALNDFCNAHNFTIKEAMIVY